MIDGILKSHSGFFDTTPSGELINKFSSDLSILDNNLFFTLIDSIEGPMWHWSMSVQSMFISFLRQYSA